MNYAFPFPIALNLNVLRSNPDQYVHGPRDVEPVNLERMRTWAPNADEAATGMLAVCEGVARGRSGAWRDSRPGLLALMTTLPGRPYNGLYGLDATASPEDATALAVDLAASGVSWCARLRPSVPDEVDEALGDQGLFAEDEALLMAASLTANDFERFEPPELTLTARRSGDDPAIATVLRAAFGTEPSSAAKLLDSAHLKCEGIQWHLGRVGDKPVACAMSVMAGGALGIFAVGTVPEARGRGYGSAVTSRALTQGLAAGAGFGVLTASPDVQNVYLRLGFRVLERWRRLVPWL